jgi:hypothetical protein
VQKNTFFVFNHRPVQIRTYRHDNAFFARRNQKDYCEKKNNKSMSFQAEFPLIPDCKHTLKQAGRIDAGQLLGRYQWWHYTGDRKRINDSPVKFKPGQVVYLPGWRSRRAPGIKILGTEVETGIRY